MLVGTKEIIFDVSELEKLCKYRWSMGRHYPNHRGTNMHRMVMGNPPKGFVTDHINHDKLDNRKDNLRFITKQENNTNRILVNKHGYPGIHQLIDGRYKVGLTYKNSNKYLGTFVKLKDAIKARRNGELKYWGYNYKIKSALTAHQQ